MKKGFFKILAALLIIAMVQINILPMFWPLSIKPDLLLIASVLLALRFNSLPQLMLCAALCGLLKDIFGIHLFGFNTFMFCIYGSFVYFISGYLYKETAGLKFIFLICATSLHYTFLSLIFEKPYIAIGMAEAAMNCLFIPLVAKCLQPIARQPLRRGRM